MNNNYTGFGIIGVALGFIVINIILIEYGLSSLNPFFLLFSGVAESIMYLLNISMSTVYMVLIIMYLPVLILGVHYLLFEDDPKKGASNTNLYVEYRQWNFFWGWFFDGKKEIQKILTYYNKKGWKVVDFEWAKYFSHIGIFKTIAIFYITIITLGVLSYWGGFMVIFEGIGEIEGEKMDTNKNVQENNAFVAWKKQHPNKTLNDYFAEHNIEK